MGPSRLSAMEAQSNTGGMGDGASKTLMASSLHLKLPIYRWWGADESCCPGSKQHQGKEGVRADRGRADGANCQWPWEARGEGRGRGDGARGDGGRERGFTSRLKDVPPAV
ncbi:unnamed protein product [Calypogeia fissa]